jgi:hypothetical protein
MSTLRWSHALKASKSIFLRTRMQRDVVYRHEFSAMVTIWSDLTRSSIDGDQSFAS